MKNTSVKKFLACLLATTCFTGLLAGCGNEKSKVNSTEQTKQSTEQVQQSSESTAPVEEETGVTYPLEEEVTLTFAMQERAAVVANYETMGDAPFMQAWQEATGVKLEVTQYSGNEGMNLLFASGELPDIVFITSSSAYPGGMAKAIEDGAVMPITDYMEYAPDFAAVLESNEIYRKSNTTPNGEIIGFPFIRGDEYLLTSYGLQVRQDFLDAVDMEVPSTPDELYDVLKAFKEELKLEAPWSSKSGDILTHGLGGGLLTTPFGLPKSDPYVEDGIVHMGYYEKEYKDVLVWLNKLYEEGLLDPNFTVKPDTRANFMNGVSGVTMDTVGSGIGTFLNTMKDDPTFDVTGFGPLVAKEGDVPMSTHYDNPFAGHYAVITPACKNIEAAMKFLNYGYTEAGSMLFNFGIEGESYEMIDGYPTYTDYIMNNPEGLTVANAMAPFVPAAVVGGPFVQDKRYMEQYSGLPQQQAALTQWTNSDAAKYKIPATTIPSEDLAEYSKIKGDIGTYVSEMTVKYISGLEDLETFETVYLDTLKTMGVERLRELEQKAYDEFMAR